VNECKPLITGQSYMLMGPLLAAVRSVVLVGSPVYPTPLRMVEAVAAERCTMLQTGSAVVRQLMTDPAAAARLDALDTSCLRCATFCAEPVSVEVHRYAHAHITDNFVNSYWATEHGAIVFSRDVTSGAAGVAKPAPDTRCWPLPWVGVALDPESSDVVITGRGLHSSTFSST
jgi:acyl-coenzyme A synthetase/AMP-(fatty) acid ligase